MFDWQIIPTLIVIVIAAVHVVRHVFGLRHQKPENAGGCAGCFRNCQSNTVSRGSNTQELVTLGNSDFVEYSERLSQ